MMGGSSQWGFPSCMHACMACATKLPRTSGTLRPSPLPATMRIRTASRASWARRCPCPWGRCAESQPSHPYLGSKVGMINKCMSRVKPCRDLDRFRRRPEHTPKAQFCDLEGLVEAPIVCALLLAAPVKTCTCPLPLAAHLTCWWIPHSWICGDHSDGRGCRPCPCPSPGDANGGRVPPCLRC